MNNYFTEICSDPEAGSYLNLIDFVYHSTLGLREIQKKRRPGGTRYAGCAGPASGPHTPREKPSVE